MNKIIIFFWVLLFNIYTVSAQNRPGSATQSAAALPGKVYTPAAYPAGIPVNYVRSWEPQVPYSSETDVTNSGRTVEQVHKATQYVDGLGRPLQTVSWQTAPGKTDIVAPVVYDAFGREAYKFLPYTQGTDGSLKTDPFNNQLSFYTNSYKTEQAALSGEQVFFGKTDFEASPLNRPLKTMAPGNSWAGNDKGVTLQYLVNSSTDAVRSWTITFDAPGDNNNIPASTSTYEAGQLYKTVTLDEAGKAVVEYKDKEGHVVLKKVQIGDNSTIATDYSGTTGFLCTYYVYDDLSQLRFVIPPKAVTNLQDNNWQLGTTVISELCFRYEYDERQRMIAKKIPGAGWVYMVYDKRDRLVYTQDANMRSKNWWHTTLYDNLNRPIQTAMLTSPGYDRA
ncbi:MAG: hypothetical protein J0I41_21065, partial [Filimonas sp.]|nr:hypothetical protein [Filimonas sp.]